MKKIKFNRERLRLNKKAIFVIAIIALAIGFYLTIAILTSVSSFFNTRDLKFNRIVEMAVNRPIEIVNKEPEVIEIILDYPEEIDTPLEKYICDKFGTYDCKTALAIASAESGLNEGAYNYNTNDTLDIGIFQVNQVHWGKEGCTPAELFDAEKNVDCAYQIWEASGWGPWVAYQTGSYIKHVE